MNTSAWMKIFAVSAVSLGLSVLSPAAANADDAITDGAKLFVDNCVKQLPKMSKVQETVANTVKVTFGGNGIHSPGRTTYSGNLSGADIFFQSAAVTKSGFNVCKVSAKRVDQKLALNTWIKAFTSNAPRGLKLVKAEDPYGLAFYRKIQGTKYQMTLEANTGRRKSAYILIAWK